MSNLTRREKAAYATIAELEAERDALKAQLVQGEPVKAIDHRTGEIINWYDSLAHVTMKGSELRYEPLYAARPPAKPAIPEEFAIVPIEPTIKMLDACLVDGATESQRKVKNVYADIWAKMLAAAR